MKSAQSIDPIVLTGCGWITPGTTGTVDDVCDAHSKNDRRDNKKNGDWRVSEKLLDEYPDIPKTIRLDKVAWMTAIAIEHANRNASLDLTTIDGERMGLVLGCALAGQPGMIQFASEVRDQSARFVSPIHFPQTVGNYVAGAIARCFGIRGPNLTLASGSSSGLDAIIEGYALLKSAKADVILAGGSEILSEEIANALQHPNTHFSEGACFFVMERLSHADSRKVKPLAVIQHVDPSRDLQSQFDTSNKIVSTSKTRIPGAIFIEYWIGQSLAASVPAALAASVYAVRNKSVPVIDETADQNITVRQIDINSYRDQDGNSSAIIVTHTENNQRKMIELSIAVES